MRVCAHCAVTQPLIAALATTSRQSAPLVHHPMFLTPRKNVYVLLEHSTQVLLVSHPTQIVQLVNTRTIATPVRLAELTAMHATTAQVSAQLAHQLTLLTSMTNKIALLVTWRSASSKTCHSHHLNHLHVF